MASFEVLRSFDYSPSPSPSSSYDVPSFSERTQLEHQGRVAKIVVEQWTDFVLLRRSERKYNLSLLRRSLLGLARNKAEGRSLFRLALVHYASLAYTKYVAGALAEWRKYAVSQRSYRKSYLSVLAHRAILYMRKCFTQWQRWVKEQQECQLVLAFEAWTGEAKRASNSEAQRLLLFQTMRRKAVLAKWKERTRRTLHIRARTKQLEELLCKSVLQSWRENIEEKERADANKLRRHLALKSWKSVSRNRARKRERLIELVDLWRQRQRQRAYSAWKGAWLAAKDWKMQKALATTHYTNAISRMLLREWRKLCEVIAWAQMKDAHRARLNIHRMLVEWRRLAFVANDLEKRRRTVVAHLYIKRLRTCFEVLQIHKEAMNANVNAVIDVYALVNKQSALKQFKAWRDVFLPLRREKELLKEKAKEFARKTLLSSAMRAWISENSLNATERRVRDLVRCNKCSKAFHIWHKAYLERKAKELEEDKRGRALEKILFSNLLSRLLRAWQKYAYLKSAKELTVSLALEKYRRRILRDCLSKAWIPFLQYCRLKKVMIVRSEALRRMNLTKFCMISMRDHVLHSKQKRSALLAASKHYLKHVLKCACVQWKNWLIECKRRKEDESAALKKFWKASASTGIQKLMETGLWRHRSRMHALAEVNAEVTKRKVEIVEPVARIWRQRARKSSSRLVRTQNQDFLREYSIMPPKLISDSKLPQRAIAADEGVTSTNVDVSREYKELAGSAQAALEKFSILLDSEQRENNLLEEFMKRKSKDRRQPRRIN